MEENCSVFEDDRQKSTTFDFIFFVQKDESNYANCILYNTKFFLNLMNRFSIDETYVDIQFQQPYIVDDLWEPTDLMTYISDFLKNYSARKVEVSGKNKTQKYLYLLEFAYILFRQILE